MNISMVRFKSLTHSIKIEKKNNDFLCPICLDGDNQKDIIITKCRHYFHYECLNGISKPSCPYCRSYLLLNLYHVNYTIKVNDYITYDLKFLIDSDNNNWKNYYKFNINNFDKKKKIFNYIINLIENINSEVLLCYTDVIIQKPSSYSFQRIDHFNNLYIKNDKVKNVDLYKICNKIFFTSRLESFLSSK